MRHIDVIWNVLKDLFIWSTFIWVYDAPCVFRSPQKQEEGLGHLELDLQIVVNRQVDVGTQTCMWMKQNTSDGGTQIK